MNLRSDLELESTREKLRVLEQGYDELRRDANRKDELREAELDSLRKLIHQLKEEIARYQAHRAMRAADRG